MTTPTPDARIPESSLSALGLARQPFADPAVEPFEDVAIVTQLNVVLSLLQSNERIVLVQGAEGVGKTRFLERLQSLQPPGTTIRRLDGENVSGAEDLWWELVAAAEDGEVTHFTPGREQMSGYVRAARRSGMRPALLIDNAHALEPAIIAELLNAWQELDRDEEAFSLALAADPARDQAWGGVRPRDLPEGRVHATTLHPFTVEQTARYIAQHLQAAGASKDLLHENDIAEIFDASGGHPRKINVEAAKKLTAKAQPPPRKKGDPSGHHDESAAHRKKLVAKLLLAGGGGAIAAGAGAFWFLFIHLEAGPSDTERLAIDDALETEEETVAAESESIEPAENDTGTPFGLDLPGRYGFGDSTNGDADESPETQPVTPTLQLLDPEPPPEPDPLQERLAEGADWAEAEPGSRFTIQLLAASQPETLIQFLEEVSLDEPTHLVETERDGDTWYVLLHGSHSDREAARSAMEELPRTLQERGTWVRSFESVEPREE